MDTLALNHLQTITNENFDIIMNAYYEEIFYYVYKQINDIDASKDVTQEIFIKLYKYRKRYDSNKSSIRTWIYRIAQNYCIDYSKSAYSNYRRKQISLDIEIDSGEDILETVVNNEKVEIIIGIMKEMLNKKHLKIMNLYFFSELTVKEIARILNIPEKTVYNAVSESIKKIKLRMEGYVNGTI